jgi:hypothetical protein
VCAEYISGYMDHLGFSGVVASVVAGIFLAASVWPSVVSVESMHNVWHFVEFCANTLLFLLAGMMFGELIYQSRLLKVPGLKDHTNSDGVSYWRGTHKDEEGGGNTRIFKRVVKERTKLYTQPTNTRTH